MNTKSIRFSYLLVLGFLGLAGLFVSISGCQMFSMSSDPLSARNLAMVVSSVADYRNDSTVAASSKLEVDDVSGKGIVISKSLTSTTRVVTRSDGVVVTIVEVLDDNNTPGDRSDDTLTVTRTYTAWDGAARMDKIIRPLKPQADWSGWDSNDLYTQGDIKISSFINGVKISEGTETLVWRKDGDTVSIYKIIKETHRIGRNGNINKVEIVVDKNGLQKKTLYRIHVTSDGEVVVHSFTFEEITGSDGKIYTKIIKDDGSYAIVVNKKNPRIVEYYTSDGILKMRITETRDMGNGDLSVTKEFYDPSGNLVKTRKIVFSYRFIGDEVVVTKRFDNGRSVTMTITESSDGYTINRNGYTYIVKFEKGNVAIYDKDSNLIATVTFNNDGSVTVKYSGSGKETRVNM